MSDKFQNKYRIPSARLPSWDYGSNAFYFVTICTKNRKHYFGEIVVETQDLAPLRQPTGFQMQLSALGKMAEKCWYEIPQHFPFVVLDAFVVMPNHIHGIIIIDKPENDIMDGDATVSISVETQNLASLPPPKNKFGPQSKKLASILRGYKIGVTKFAKSNNIEFGWQPRFHDHIIRNDASYARIQNYIETNPQNWDNDKFKN